MGGPRPRQRRRKPSRAASFRPRPTDSPRGRSSEDPTGRHRGYPAVRLCGWGVPAASVRRRRWRAFRRFGRARPASRSRSAAVQGDHRTAPQGEHATGPPEGSPRVLTSAGEERTKQGLLGSWTIRPRDRHFWPVALMAKRTSPAQAERWRRQTGRSSNWSQCLSTASVGQTSMGSSVKRRNHARAPRTCWRQTVRWTTAGS